MVPCIYALLTNKTQVCYESVLQYINDHVMSLQCASVMTDYERGLRNAIAKVVPDAILTACWFHFCAACKKQAMKFYGNMIRLVRTNTEAANIYYRLLCLPLLPADRINDAFNELKTSAKEFPVFKGFIGYFERQWINRVSFPYFGLLINCTNNINTLKSFFHRKELKVFLCSD